MIKEHAISLVVPLHQQRFINRKCFIALLAKQTFSADIQVEFFPPIIILFSLYFLFLLYLIFFIRLDWTDVFTDEVTRFSPVHATLSQVGRLPPCPLCLSSGVSSKVILTGEQKEM